MTPVVVVYAAVYAVLVVRTWHGSPLPLALSAALFGAHVAALGLIFS